MESLSLRNLLLLPTSTIPHPIPSRSRSCPINNIHATPTPKLHRKQGFITSCTNSTSTSSSLPDFQDYTKPRRLLPVAKPKLDVDESLQKIISNFHSDGSQSLYKVTLQTSSIYDSGLTDLNAGVLICIIDENGDSILQRIPAVLFEDHIVHFQSGSCDEFIFWGPNVGRIWAMWISVESGKWRLADASLIIISICNNHEAEDDNKEGSLLYCCMSYNFDVEDVLVGEGSDMTMAELRPSQVTEDMTDSLVSVSMNKKAECNAAEMKEITKEESMREYADLKNSLLLYDAVLIILGACISKFTGGENASVAYLSGGVGGFLYLLLLQRSVDELPAPAHPQSSSLSSTSTSTSVVEGNKGISNLNKVMKGGSGSLVVLLLALGFGVTMLASEGIIQINLTPREILVGMVGFFASKISVVLAAFKPISSSSMEMDTQDN